MTVTETTAPTVTPVTLNEVRANARIDASDLDDLVQDVMIPAAVDLSQKYANRSWIQRTLTVAFDQEDIHGSVLRLPYGPVSSVTSITWTDTAGSTATSATTDYYLAGDEIHFLGVQAQRPIGGVSVVYVTGYGTTASSVPGAVRLAIIKMVTTMLESPEDAAPDQMFSMPYQSRSLLDTVAVIA